ncbi:hypothetical protein H0Z60_09405 [Ectothiorhodospiraceae bacterium WFHF3C12]|nr:hypothetical protein [Ectothiorhodospiraceae bacterium WFHF3C12]
MAAGEEQAELRMDTDNLYLEEAFTDRRIGSIMRMTPVDGDGNRDESRSVVYVGQTQIMTPAGALPLSFEIEAQNLKDAGEKFAEEARKAADDTIRRLQEMQREQASSIVTPDSMGGGGLGGQGGYGGQGGPGGSGGFTLR